MTAISSEKGEEVVAALQSLPVEVLGQVMFMATDAPSYRLVSLLRDACPQFQVLSLDPVHLAFVWEYSTWKKRTQGSRVLRSILAKLSQHDPACAPDYWGPAYIGRAAPPLTLQENQMREQIKDSSMGQRKARNILNQIDCGTPFKSRLEFVEALAAISSVHHDEVARVSPGPNRKVRELLWSAASADRLEWYMNNIRFRHMMNPYHLPLLHVGTTSNESLHKEINTWFRQTQHMHQATLDLKLSVLHFGKLLAHNGAMYHHTLSQIPHAVVLARASAVSPWTVAQWSAWCKENVDGEAVVKATLPMEKERQKQKAKVKAKAAAIKEATRKRPAERNLKRKRTPFTLERVGQIRRPAKKK